MGNLTNLLGVLIGIVTVMLLLSLVVTALSQTAATMLGLRWRSGRRTIVRFVHEELGRSKSEATRIADEIYRLPGAQKDERFFEKIGRQLLRLRGARVPQEVGWKDVEPSVKEHTTGDWNQLQFARLRGRISDDYSRLMKSVTFGLSFVVAFAFQVSTTKLMRDLSTSDELRAKALELSVAAADSADAAKNATDSARANLASLDIQFLQDLSFYYIKTDNADGNGCGYQLLWGNIVGVLMTGILLTLGAPFWYNRLKDLKVFQNQLRDAIGKESVGGEAVAKTDGAKGVDGEKAG